MMVNQEENVSYLQLENCSSTAKEFIWNLYGSKSGTIVIVFNIVLNVVLMFTASIGNGMIIVAMLRSQSLQTPSYLLITSLAFTDLLMGLIFHPLQIALSIFNLQNDVQGVCGMIQYYVFFTPYLGFASVLMVTSISIDRYLALTLRHRYNIIVTKKRVRLLILIVWIALLFVSFPATIERVFHSYYILASCVFTAFILATCVFYIKSYRSLHLYTIQVQAQQPNPLAGNFDVVRYKKTLKTMLVVLGCFLLSCLPLVCSFIARVTLGLQKEVLILRLISFTLMGLNSSINPIIYLVKFPDIRHACGETLTYLVH